ncbi:MAG: cytochrome P450 [Actinobacteria bacterium]|nr:cytochrome P450 [Actinomycetota bacterium]MBV9255310.1 cytochrome P450 [Actinomycetota bacterium]MBV9935126.1 cytochrome P450 [Actinomycetota bacterium]
MITEQDIDLVAGSFWGRNPHDELAWLRANAPVWRDPKHGVWGVATYELIKQVSSQPKLFGNAGGIRPETGPIPMMIDMDDPEHWQRRKLVNRGFTPSRVRDQEASIRRTARLLIDAVRERETFDLVWDLAAWLPLIVIGDALGVEPPDRDQLLQWSDDMLRALGSDDEELLTKAMLASVGYHEYASKIISARRAQRVDDLMGILATAEVDGDQLSDEEIVMESLLILIGGDETTRHVITGGAYQLLHQRQNWEALVADRGLLDTTIEEMLRWVTPIKNMARTAMTDAELNGQTIPKGEKLLLLYPSANRDEAVFPDANTFDIRRTPNEHVAFGFGTHFCLGASLARLELRVLFEELLDQLPDLELVDDAEPTFRAANFVSGYESMPVRTRRGA